MVQKKKKKKKRTPGDSHLHINRGSPYQKQKKIPGRMGEEGGEEGEGALEEETEENKGEEGSERHVTRPEKVEENHSLL